MRRKSVLSVGILTLVMLTVYVWIATRPAPRLTLAQLRTVKVGMTSDDVAQVVGVPPGCYAWKGGLSGGAFTDVELKEMDITHANGDAMWMTRFHTLVVRYDRDRRVSEVELTKRHPFADWCVEQKRGRPFSEEDWLEWEKVDD